MKKSVINLFKVWHILFLGGLLIFLTSNCTKDSLLEETESNVLKAQQLIPKYQTGTLLEFSGMINDDYIEIKIPAIWNGMIIVYAHGYVDPIAELALPEDKVDGVLIKDLITSNYFGYASTSYSENGFAVKEAVNDIKFLGNLIKAHYKPTKLYIGGVSEGGLVAMKMLEREDQDVYDAGLVVCGPIGDFNAQLDYFGDFHVLFNYLFAPELASINLNLGSPEGVPETLVENWYSIVDNLDNLITDQNIWKLPVLLNTAKVPTEGVPLELYPNLIKDILRFNIMATNDMIERVHGVPYDNSDPDKVYTCDYNVFPPGTDYSVYLAFMAQLNYEIKQNAITADKQALQRIELLYETSGSPNVPVVLMHNTGDHIAPIFHYYEYLNKTDRPDLIYPIEKNTPGHCNFDYNEIINGIGIMVALSNN